MFCFLDGTGTKIVVRLNIATWVCTGCMLNVFHARLLVLYAELGGLASEIVVRLNIATWVCTGCIPNV